MRAIACGVVLLLYAVTGASAGQHVFTGLRLEEALRLLQRDGLAIVFSSETVTPDMRVAAEPKAKPPRRQLDDMLAEHGLRAEDGPGRTILVVRALTPAVEHRASAAHRGTPERPPLSRAVDAAATLPSYIDRVSVFAAPERVEAAPGAVVFDRTALQTVNSPLDADGLSAVHAMPGVAVLDDSRSDFSVRGSPYRQVATVIDGVSTRWLQHAVYGPNGAGSLAMFGSNVLERITLRAGAYPRTYDDTLGAQLEVTLREGSREATRVVGTAGGTTAAVVGEGPIASGRGSWIAGARNSYRAWPPRPLSQGEVGFAFADAHAKLVYDLSPTDEADVTVLAGRSVVDAPDEPLVGPLSAGTNRAALVTAGWRSTHGPKYVIRHRVFWVGQDLESTLGSGQLAGHSSNDSLGYRGEVQRALLGGVIEGGADISRLSGVREGRDGPDGVGRATWTTHAAYANFARTTRHVSLEAGVRAGSSTLVHDSAVSPWFLAAWRFAPAWTLSASVGASRQFPDLDAVWAAGGAGGLAAERATHADVAVARDLGTVRWQVTYFERFEADVLRGYDEPWTGRDGPAAVSLRNALEGESRGFETVVTRSTGALLSGWMSYSCAMARQIDVMTHEPRSDQGDWRHAFTAAGRFRIGPQSSAGLLIRAASGLPPPALFSPTEPVSTRGEPARQRAASYVRLDGHVQHTFFSSPHAVTVFGEALNVLNRQNATSQDRLAQPGLGGAIPSTGSGLSRRFSVGVSLALDR